MPFVNAITDPEPTPFLLPLLQNWIVLKIYPPEGKYSFVVHEPRCKPSRIIKHSDIKISNHIPVLPESRQLKWNSSGRWHAFKLLTVQRHGYVIDLGNFYISVTQKTLRNILLRAYKSLYDDFSSMNKFRCMNGNILCTSACIYTWHTIYRFILLQRLVFCMSKHFRS